MGNAQSNNHLYHRIDEIVPTSETRKWEMFDKTSKPFAGHKDREQFIWAVITVITQNGILLLGDHQIRLLYSRRANDRLVARLVAEKEGIIKTKIEPTADGRDQAEAFNALRRDIEIRLDRILSDVPGEPMPPAKFGDSPASLVVKPPTPVVQPPAPGRCGSGGSRRPLAPPPPPAEAGDADRIMIHNEGPPAYGVAVREWRTSDEKRG